MMESIPIVFFAFKFLVLGTGMFFAIKWHYDQGKKGKTYEKRTILLAAGKIAALFTVLLLALALFTFVLVKKFGM